MIVDPGDKEVRVHRLDRETAFEARVIFLECPLTAGFVD